MAMSDEWRLGINDPTLFAWLIVGFYLLGAIGCWRSQKNSQWRKGTRIFPSWGLLGGALLILGINKQLDLHTPLLMNLQRIRSDSTSSSAIGLAFLLSVSVLIATCWSYRNRFVYDVNFRLFSVCSALVALLSVQVLRFSTGAIASWLTMHPFGDDGIWHLHLVELFELALIVLISVLAWHPSSNQKEVAQAES
jgi:hypothetical protein